VSIERCLTNLYIWCCQRFRSSSIY